MWFVRCVMLLSVLIPVSICDIRDMNVQIRSQLEINGMCRNYRGWQAAFERAREDAMEGRRDVTWAEYVAMKEGDHVPLFEVWCADQHGGSNS